MIFDLFELLLLITILILLLKKENKKEIKINEVKDISEVTKDFKKQEAPAPIAKKRGRPKKDK